MYIYRLNSDFVTIQYIYIHILLKNHYSIYICTYFSKEKKYIYIYVHIFRNIRAPKSLFNIYIYMNSDFGTVSLAAKLTFEICCVMFAHHPSNSGMMLLGARMFARAHRLHKNSDKSIL